MAGKEEEPVKKPVNTRSSSMSRSARTSSAEEAAATAAAAAAASIEAAVSNKLTSDEQTQPTQHPGAAVEAFQGEAAAQAKDADTTNPAPSPVHAAQHLSSTAPNPAVHALNAPDEPMPDATVNPAPAAEELTAQESIELQSSGGKTQRKAKTQVKRKADALQSPGAKLVDTQGGRPQRERNQPTRLIPESSKRPQLNKSKRTAKEDKDVDSEEPEAAADGGAEDDGQDDSQEHGASSEGDLPHKRKRPKGRATRGSKRGRGGRGSQGKAASTKRKSESGKDQASKAQREATVVEVGEGEGPVSKNHEQTHVVKTQTGSIAADTAPAEGGLPLLSAVEATTETETVASQPVPPDGLKARGGPQPAIKPAAPVEPTLTAPASTAGVDAMALSPAAAAYPALALIPTPGHAAKVKSEPKPTGGAEFSTSAQPRGRAVSKPAPSLGTTPASEPRKRKQLQQDEKENSDVAAPLSTMRIASGAVEQPTGPVIPDVNSTQRRNMSLAKKVAAIEQALTEFDSKWREVVKVSELLTNLINEWHQEDFTGEEFKTDDGSIPKQFSTLVKRCKGSSLAAQGRPNPLLVQAADSAKKLTQIWRGMHEKKLTGPAGEHSHLSMTAACKAAAAESVPPAPSTAAAPAKPVTLTPSLTKSAKASPTVPASEPGIPAHRLIAGPVPGASPARPPPSVTLIGGSGVSVVAPARPPSAAPTAALAAPARAHPAPPTSATAAPSRPPPAPPASTGGAAVRSPPAHPASTAKVEPAGGVILRATANGSCPLPVAPGGGALPPDTILLLGFRSVGHPLRDKWVRVLRDALELGPQQPSLEVALRLEANLHARVEDPSDPAGAKYDEIMTRLWLQLCNTPVGHAQHPCAMPAPGETGPPSEELIQLLLEGCMRPDQLVDTVHDMYTQEQLEPGAGHV